ncbi:MAG: hypothetical protein K2O29_09615, partial [Ruminococcus sp.]|nr:hypothetical protein [Ruminococcus sp.]
LITQGEKASQEMIYNETLSESVQEENRFSESAITDTEIFKSTEISENVSAETSIQITSSEITSDVDLSFSDDVSDTKTTVTVINYGNKTEDNKKRYKQNFYDCSICFYDMFDSRNCNFY